MNDEVKTEADVTGPRVRAIRKRLGLSLPEFWGPLGVQSTTGGRLETENVKPSKPVRIAVFTRYVAGLELDATTEVGVADIRNLARIKNLIRIAKKH